MIEKLTKTLVLQLIREEESRITPGLRVKHKKTGLKYTVDRVANNAITLLTPELTDHPVPADEFERDYEPA